ncbi:hypothetical protein NDU88_002718 [Pleurodeles waltl]|uniref:Uncharacterized protein n=1 Tax=Pleurodeles waltl TaxID=8319 RepID=A0AAV7P7K0_PLEWA|nr:hypothetical protein NDU88_002718 [Pleurodeles waltl]
MGGREEEYLQAAVALLEKAGRMDLLRQEALPALCPARKAAHGVAAAVMACSPPRAGSRAGQVRKGGRGGGRLLPGKRGRVVCGPAGPGRAIVSSSGKGGAQMGSRVRLGRGGRGASRRAAGGGSLGSRDKGGRQGGGRGGQAGGAGQVLQPGGHVVSLVQSGRGGSGGGESGGQEKGGEYDPLIPVSSKWPTMLEWSASESEGEQAEAGEEESGGVPPPHCAARSPEESLWGAREDGASSGYYGGPRFFAARDFVFSGTPDLPGQRKRREEGEPGERRAARSPWSEEQAEPRAAGRSTSPGRLSGRRVAADTPGKRCGGRGCAPASASASWERRPGPAGVQVGAFKRSAVEAAVVEGPRRAQEAWDYGMDPWCVDHVLDYDETILEEGGAGG